MTTRQTFRSAGTSYTVTATETITPDGDVGHVVTCDCATNHPGSAIVRGSEIDLKTVHGNVTLAYHPVLGRAARNVWKV